MAKNRESVRLSSAENDDDKYCSTCFHLDIVVFFRWPDHETLVIVVNFDLKDRTKLRYDTIIPAIMIACQYGFKGEVKFHENVGN